jgi:hypothetical protein
MAIRHKRGRGVPRPKDLTERQLGIDKRTGEVYLKNDGEIVDIGGPNKLDKKKLITVQTSSDIPEGLDDGTYIAILEE